MEYYDCRKCKEQYETHVEHDGNSIQMHEYCRYLGICGIDCWNKISPVEQNRELLFGWVHGDTRKRAGFKVG
jgi:hypothetical protein